MEDQKELRKRQREHEDPEKNVARSKAGAETPSSKEVEEFFEILRRMHVAVRYFDNKVNGDGDGKSLSGRLWEALETGRMELANATSTTSEGDCGAEMVANEPAAENNRVFDLKSEPDQDITEIAVNTGCITCWCLCISLGQDAEIIDKGKTSCAIAGIIYYLLGDCAGSALAISVPISASTAAVPCVLSARELKNRGFDPSICWVPNAEKQNMQIGMTAPAFQPGITHA